MHNSEGENVLLEDEENYLAEIHPFGKSILVVAVQTSLSLAKKAVHSCKHSTIGFSMGNVEEESCTHFAMQTCITRGEIQ